MPEHSLLVPNINRFFAVPLSGSKYRHWTDEDRFSIMTFDWEGIPVKAFSPKETININVAQQNPNYSVKEVKNVADGIYYTSRLNNRDGILGIDQENVVKKVGVVSHKSIKSQQVTIDINWIDEVSPFNFPSNVDKTTEILKIAPKTLNQLAFNSSSFKKLLEKSQESFTNFDEFISRNANEYKFESKEISKYIDFKKDPGGEIELFYGTNRIKTNDNHVQHFYGSELDDLQLGICKVSIPPGHKQGELERPRKILFWQLNENKNEHVILSSINPLENEDFYRWMNKAILTSQNKSALLFIHGYNTTFAEAAWRTGQIAYDIPFNEGICGFFSWPSTGGTIDYARDIERADASVQNCAKFIENVVQGGNVQQLHLIAHSMGNRVLTRALNDLIKKESFREKIKTISQIVLAAPDIDREVFDREILPIFKSVGNRRTLYASDKDKALKFSRKIRTGLIRIGEAGDNIYVADGLDTIDASNVMSEGNHHSYIFETKELLTDIHTLVTQGLEPVKRRLREVKKDPSKYWLFKE